MKAFPVNFGVGIWELLEGAGGMIRNQCSFTLLYWVFLSERLGVQENVGCRVVGGIARATALFLLWYQES